MSKPVTLMDRAKALVSSKNCAAAAALAIVPLAASPAKGVLTTWAMTDTFAYGGIGPWQSQATPIPGGIKITGQLGPISGSTDPDGQLGTLLNWSGNFTGSILPGQRIRIDFDFIPTFTGGTFHIGSINGQIPDLEIDFDTFEMDDEPYVSGQLYHGSYLSEAATSEINGGTWKKHIEMAWNGYAASDTFTLTIPDNSIDITVEVPEPASGAVLMLSALALVARRRRNGA